MLWLKNVKETQQILSGPAPIGVRRITLGAGPVVDRPECHPYCEFSILLKGEIIQYGGKAEAHRRPGDVFLAGPMLPHWAEGVRYPVEAIAVCFLPSVLIEMGPLGDGLNLLRRFIGDWSGQAGMYCPPPALVTTLREGFADIAREFDDCQPGRELRLRARLALIMTDFDRWEHSQPPLPNSTGQAQWERINRALSYLQDHFSEPIYSSQLADHLEMSESSMRTLFRQTIGSTWSRYLQAYRVHQAVTLLASDQMNVTEVAGAVGFESLNQFETTFRAQLGVTPRGFARACRTGGRNS